MKIEPTKSHQANRKDSHVDKVENSNRFSTKQTNFADSAATTAAQTTGAFAKILDEARKDAAKNKDFSPAEKADRADSASESSDSDNDTKANRNVSGQDEVEERQENKNESDAESGDDNSGSFAGLIFQPEIKAPNEGSTPAARSILHVADLERIVSAMRAQTLKDARQIIIALKHSVLEGLQIKLTVEENGKLKAEFLAANEQIKNQLNARKDELNGIFRERGINFAEMNIRQDSGSPNQFANDSFMNKIESAAADSIDEEKETSETDGETSYRI